MRDLLTPAEAAERLRVSRPYVYKLVSLGLLPAVSWAIPEKGAKPSPVIRTILTTFKPSSTRTGPLYNKTGDGSQSRIEPALAKCV
jgi:hypothetical protein